MNNNLALNEGNYSMERQGGKATWPEEKTFPFLLTNDSEHKAINVSKEMLHFIEIKLKSCSIFIVEQIVNFVIR